MHSRWFGSSTTLSSLGLTIALASAPVPALGADPPGQSGAAVSRDVAPDEPSPATDPGALENEGGAAALEDEGDLAPREDDGDVTAPEGEGDRAAPEGGGDRAAAAPPPTAGPSSSSAPPPRPTPAVPADDERAPGLEAPPADRRGPRGLGLTIAGSVLSTTGTSTWLTGLVLLGLSADEKPLQSLGLATFVPGILVATAGYVMAAVGVKRVRASYRARQRITGTLRLDSTQAGGGLSIRF